MNNDNGRLNFSAGIDNSQLQADAEESRRLLRGISKTASEEGARIDESFKKIGEAAAGIFAVSQIKSFVSQVANVRGEFQQLEIAFKTMLGSAAQANALMSQLVKTAATTPFGLTDIAQSAKQLLAYGVEADKVNETLIRLGDIAAGLSIPINDLAYLYGTTMVQGRLYTQDLNQFLGRGIPLIEQLAQQFGVAESEVKKLVEEGKVGFPEVEQAIINLTNEGSMFGGLMAAQSQSIIGQISNIEDAIDTMFNEIGKKSEGIINTSLDIVSTLIENWETIGKVLLTVIATYGAYKAAVIAVAAAHKLMNIWGTVSAVLSLAKSITSAKDAMLLFNMAVKANPLGLVLSVVAAAASAFALFRDTTDEAAEAIKAEREEAEEFNKRVGESAGKAISTYKNLQDEYKNCKTAHEKRQWIKDSQTKFKELGIAVTSVNDAENIFVKNTSIMMSAFKKRAEAAAWQSKIEEEYAKRVTRQMQLEDQIEKIQAGSIVQGTSHSTQGGNEYVDRNGNWVYTEQGAKKAREVLKNNMENDPVLKAIDERIETYSKNMADVSSDFQSLFEQAGTSTKTQEEQKAKEKEEKEKQKIADEAAQRNSKIKEYSEKVSEAVRQAELDIRQAEIDAMEEGYNKSVAQVNLNYDRLIAENEKRKQDMLDELADAKTLEWQNANPNATKAETLAYRSSLNLTVADLTPEQRNMLESYADVARKIQVKGNEQALEDMLKDVQTYEQQRTEIAEEYEQKRKQLYKTDDKDGNYVVDENGIRQLREGVTEGNVDELKLQEQNALQAVDEQFAQREATYRAWCNDIAKMTLEELERALADAEAALTEAQNNGTSGTELAEARAKVQTAKNQLSKVKENDTRPDKRSIEEWNDLREALEDCVSAFEEIGNTVGDVAGEIISTAGQISTSSISMINGIVQLTNMSTTSISKTATAAATAISMVEKASVILTIISAAIQIVMKIVDLFNKDDERQEKIDSLQSQIDQLQWEIDNIDISTFQSKVGTSMDLMKKSIAQARVELMMAKYNVGDLQGAFDVLVGKYKYDSEVLSKSIQKLSDNFANLEYSSTNALGDEKYLSGREQLEKYSEQILLTKKQIDEESQKKDPNQEQIDEWNRQIEELGNEAASVINEMVDEIIGGSAAEIANELGDAFFEAARQGEDAMKAWGEKADEIVSDIIKRMLISEFLEKPLGDIFEEYKNRWFKDGNFLGFDSVKGSMADFSNEINSLVGDFSAGMDGLPDELKEIILGNAEEQTREATEKGIATASQDSVDELNGRATAIQGHTYSISENMKMLLTTSNLILQSVLNIEDNTDDISSRMANLESDMRVMRNTVNDMNLKGIKIKY